MCGRTPGKIVFLTVPRVPRWRVTGLASSHGSPARLGSQAVTARSVARWLSPCASTGHGRYGGMWRSRGDPEDGVQPRGRAGEGMRGALGYAGRPRLSVCLGGGVQKYPSSSCSCAFRLSSSSLCTTARSAIFWWRIAKTRGLPLAPNHGGGPVSTVQKRWSSRKLTECSVASRLHGSAGGCGCGCGCGWG